MVAERSGGCENAIYDYFGKTTVQDCAKMCKDYHNSRLLSLQRFEHCDGVGQCECYCLLNADPDTCVKETQNEFQEYDLIKIVEGKCFCIFLTPSISFFPISSFFC